MKRCNLTNISSHELVGKEEEQPAIAITQIHVDEVKSVKMTKFDNNYINSLILTKFKI